MKQMPILNLNNIPAYLLSHKYENEFSRKCPNSCSNTWREYFLLLNKKGISMWREPKCSSLEYICEKKKTRWNGKWKQEKVHMIRSLKERERGREQKCKRREKNKEKKKRKAKRRLLRSKQEFFKRMIHLQKTGKSKGILVFCGISLEAAKRGRTLFESYTWSMVLDLMAS